MIGIHLKPLGILKSIRYYNMHHSHHKRIFKRCRRHELRPCERHGRGHMQDRAFTCSHKDSFHRILGHMAHHRRNMVRDRYGQPYKIQRRKMAAPFHCEIIQIQAAVPTWCGSFFHYTVRTVSHYI